MGKPERRNGAARERERRRRRREREREREAMDGGDGTAPAEDLFPIFVVAILSVFTIPWTINKVFCSESKEEVVHGKMKKEDVKRKVIEKVFSKSNIILALCWVVLIGLTI